jgi:pimeloyl-ACP methyl ester carboxylesterase
VCRSSVMGWSWGTVIMGAYTADHNDKVDRLVLYAPTWLRTAPPPQTAPPPLGAYVAAPMATARERLQAGAPDDRKNDLMPASWFEAWSAAALDSDPVGSKQEPPVLRSPAGVFQDNRNYWDAQADVVASRFSCRNRPPHQVRRLSGAFLAQTCEPGKAYCEPERITSPTLVIVAEWDRVTPARAHKRSSTSFRVVRTSGSSRSARERILLCWRRTGCNSSGRCNSSSMAPAGIDSTGYG